MGGLVSDYQPLGGRKVAKIGQKWASTPIFLAGIHFFGTFLCIGPKLRAEPKFHVNRTENGRVSTTGLRPYSLPPPSMKMDFWPVFRRAPPLKPGSRRGENGGPENLAGRPFGPAAKVLGPSKRGLSQGIREQPQRAQKWAPGLMVC